MPRDITPTSRLEAINQMLRAIGESPVSSLTEDLGMDLPTATETLDEILRAVLVEGWTFNTEYKFPLVRDSAGEIVVPRNALSIDVDKVHLRNTDPILRGPRLYDRKNHTYKFSTNLSCTVIFGLPFEELPEAARHYIAYRACRKFQDTQTGSNDLHRYTVDDEVIARAVLMSTHADEADLNMLTSTPDFQLLWS